MTNFNIYFNESRHTSDAMQAFIGAVPAVKLFVQYFHLSISNEQQNLMDKIRLFAAP